MQARQLTTKLPRTEEFIYWLKEQARAQLNCFRVSSPGGMRGFLDRDRGLGSETATEAPPSAPD